MSNLTLHPESRALIRPEPRSAVAIRVGVPGDLKFIDQLQRMHSKQVGWMPSVQLETNLKQGNFVIAEDGTTKERIGYCLFKDRYFKREDVGIVYQLNVMPTKQRGLVGAALIKAAFERCPYGVKLFCCWCAQDIEANHFWESIGFVPLAFRAGSRGAAEGGRRKEGRIHIFWQRRIREGDLETPYWYPSETSGGALKENRIVLPIPPGTHWSDAKPTVLPGMEKHSAVSDPATAGELSSAEKKPRAKAEAKVAVAPQSSIRLGGLRFAPGKKPVPTPKEIEAKSKRERLPRQKNDPKLVAAAREFRDRYLEQVNAKGGDRLLASNGKYDVSRHLAAGVVESMPLLNAA